MTEGKLATPIPKKPTLTGDEKKVSYYMVQEAGNRPLWKKVKGSTPEAAAGSFVSEQFMENDRRIEVWTHGTYEFKWIPGRYELVK